MKSEVNELSGSNIDTLLDQARQALRIGDAKTCRELANSALQIAQERNDVRLEAKAHLCLANGDRMVSRFRRSNSSSQRAAFLFQLCGDRLGEAEALATLSYTFIVLSRNDEAIEAALLSVKLIEQSVSVLALAYSYNYLGVAYSYSWNFKKSNEAFNFAIQILEREERWADAYLPRMNQRFMQIVKMFYDRYYTGQLPSLEQLKLLKEAHEPAITAPEKNSILQGAYVKSQSILLLTSALEQCWLGNLEQASTDVEMSSAQVVMYECNPSFGILEYCVRAEIAWAKKDWAGAEQYAKKMIELAIQVENEHLATIGYLLASQILNAQGKDAQSQEQLKLLRFREQTLRNEAIKSREAVVEWQLKVRASHENIQRMEAEAKQLERLSFEDALTGLPNQRRFWQYLPEMLRKGFEQGMHPFIVFVDIEKFKVINDRFSHKVGDEVLKRIAFILKEFARDGDMPARIAGDKFVIAFENVDSFSMGQVTERISTAASDFDWASIQDGLCVSVNFGVLVPRRLRRIKGPQASVFEAGLKMITQSAQTPEN